MSTLVDAARLKVQQYLHRIRVLPIVIVYLNNVCDSRCITCWIWKNNDLLKNPAERQMSEAMIEELYSTLKQWRPRQVLLSGGEPVLHPLFGRAVAGFRHVAPTVGVITNGLLLSGCEPSVLQGISEFYISFDAPDAAGYRKIRGVDGFERLSLSMRTLKRLRPRPRITARCTLQRENIRALPRLVEAARQLGFDGISFLGVDASSTAFSRHLHGAADAATILPEHEDLTVMEHHIRSLRYSDGFVEGGADKLNRILQYFRALRGDGPFASIRCNAPWVSVVIETTGEIRGCFFQPVIGDFSSINGEQAQRFRQNLDVGSDSTCQRCVCSKFLGVRDFIHM